MKTIFYLIILLLVSVGLTSCFSQETKKATSNLEGKIKDDSIRKLIEENAINFPNNTQVSIALITENSTKYIGVIRKNDVLEVTDNQEKIFEIGSISKVFTAVLFSDFISKNKALLTETLQNNFDYTIKEGGKITLQQLANHTSGLARMPKNISWMTLISDQPYDSYTPELLQKYLSKEIKLKNKIGKKNQYSNLGAGLLGYILTKKSGKNYDTLLQDVICNKLGMNNTSSDLKNYNKKQLIKGLNALGDEIPNWNFTDVLVGAGGIKSNVKDLEKFVRKNFENDSIYNLPQQETFTISETMKIGLGWHIFSKSNTLWHNGGTAGFKSCLALNKDKKIGVIVLSNISGLGKQGNIIDRLCFQLLKEIK